MFRMKKSPDVLYVRGRILHRIIVDPRILTVDASEVCVTNFLPRGRDLNHSPPPNRIESTGRSEIIRYDTCTEGLRKILFISAVLNHGLLIQPIK